MWAIKINMCVAYIPCYIRGYHLFDFPKKISESILNVMQNHDSWKFTWLHVEYIVSTQQWNQQTLHLMKTVETTVDFITGNQWVTVPSCDVSSCMSRPVSSSSSASASYGRILPSDRERWSFWRGLTLSCVDKRLAEFDRWRSPDDSFPELFSDTGCRYDILRPDGIEKREFRRVDIFL